VELLRIEEAKLHLYRAHPELKQSTFALAETTWRYQLFVSEYLDFLQKNSSKIQSGTSPNDLMKGWNTEQPLLGFESGFLGTALELSKYLRKLTAKAAQWEANYLQTMQSYGAGK